MQNRSRIVASPVDDNDMINESLKKVWFWKLLLTHSDCVTYRMSAFKAYRILDFKAGFIILLPINMLIIKLAQFLYELINQQLRRWDRYHLTMFKALAGYTICFAGFPLRFNRISYNISSQAWAKEKMIRLPPEFIAYFLNPFLRSYWTSFPFPLIQILSQNYNLHKFLHCHGRY